MRTFLLGLRIKYIPVGSRRERVYHLLRLMLFKWRQSGFISAILTVKERARFYLSKELSFSRSGYTYQQWILDHEPNKEMLNQQRELSGQFSRKPTISIITPVYNPDPAVLRDTINSVMTQTYPYWQLCLADGGSTLDGVVGTLDEYAQKDARISIKHLSENLGISGNSNAALSMASGEYIALMDHDDLLAPDMLYEVVKVINQKPDVEIIYFDEDKISADGRTRLDPFFKPSAWSPDLLLSTNYLMHSVISRSLVDEYGGFRSEVDGAQDWDLSLRITREKRNIHHIPKVFYHWRQVPGSASREANAKPWAFAAQARCIEDHLQELGENDARVDFPGLGTVHVSWGNHNSKVSIIIPSKDNVELISACINSILEKTLYENYEILIIDTGSKDQATLDFYDEITQNSHVTLHLYADQFNFHKVNNYGADLASGELLLFLNNDTEVINPSWLEELAAWAKRPGIGVVGTKLLYPDGNIQHAGIVMGVEGHGSHVFERLPEHHYGPFGSPDWYRDYMAVTGACMMIPRKVFTDLGGFDEIYGIGYGDIDICLRAVEAGYRVIYTPFAELVHHEGGTRGYSLPPNDVLRASNKMYEIVRRGDSFFNPNLSYLHRQPTISNPQEPKREDRILRILHDFNLVDTTALEFNPIPGENLIAEPVAIQQFEQNKGKLMLISHELSLTGAPMILGKLAKFLRNQGFGVSIVSPIPGPLLEELTTFGIEVFINPLILRDAREMLRYLDNCDLVISNTILSWRCIYSAKSWPVPSIWWVHESQFGLDHIARYPQVSGAFQAADVLVFPSRETASIYRPYSGGTPVEILHNALDTKQLNSYHFKDINLIDNDAFSIINIASYEPRKGQDILIKSLDNLPDDVDVDCYLVGRRLDWLFSQQLSFKARRRKNLHLIGEQSHEKTMSYLQEADVFVLPSRDEVMPMALLEAMYFKKAVIVSEVGGIPEVITHGEDGLIFEKGDGQQLSEHLIRLYRDREYLNQLGKNGHEKVLRDLSAERFEAKWMSIISQIIGETN